MTEQGTIRHTVSVCPVCLRRIPAAQVRRGGTVYLEKSCPQHGRFATPIWRDRLALETWRAGARPLAEGENPACPGCQGICADHQQATCCALLEVTSRCDLRCRFCFAGAPAPEPALAQLKRAVDDIAAAGGPLLQLSGGEPSLRDDLPELVAYAKRQGCSYVQLNSNGLRLARDEAYLAALAAAGLDFVFLQFDAVDDAVYRQLRGAPLLAQKQRVIELCDKYCVGVTLVPTVVRGVNTAMLGDILRFAVAQAPAVRGVHFQPASFFGRYPHAPQDDDRYTLDELLSDLIAQSGGMLSPAQFHPSRCDHPLCGFHAGYIVSAQGGLLPLAPRGNACCCAPRRTTAAQNRAYIGRRWQRPAAPENQAAAPPDLSSLDGFLARARSHAFTLTAMAFQDAWNLDIERLRQCSLHVYADGMLKPFCGYYLTAAEEAHGC